MRVEKYLVQATDVDADGFIVTQPDGYGEQGCGWHEAVSPYGFMGRALAPDVDQDQNITAGALQLAFIDGGNWLTLHLTDRRVIAGLPLVQPGESMQYGAKFNFVKCRADGGVQMFTTTDGTGAGSSCFLGITRGASGNLGRRGEGPWGREFFDETGWHVQTTSGATLHMGGLGGMPSPMDQLASCIVAAAAMVQVESSVIALGSGGVFDPAAKSTPTLILMTQIAACFSALAAGGLVAPSGGGPCVPNATFGAALTTLQATLAGAQTALPSTAVTVS